MAKKFFQKALSVGLSLTLCAGLVAPSFAAVALNKDLHIDVNGYLKENEEKNYDYYLDQDIELDKTLVIKDGVDASIDLKGNDLEHTGATGSVISIKGGGKLELGDTTAKTDADGNYTAGHVTGGKGNDGGGVYVEKGGALDMAGGIISGNKANWGGGIYSKGTVVMSGGQIFDNTADWGGGMFNGNQFTMTGDAAIIGNTSSGDGGGLYNSGDFLMESGKINGNISGFDGGGIYSCIWWNANGPHDINITMNGGEIADNRAVSNERWAGGGGVSIENRVTFTMNGGSIVRNEAKGATEELTGPNGVEGGGSVVIDYDNVIICNYGKDGKANTVHDPAAPVRENETENFYDEVVYCEDCHGEISRVHVTISRNNNNTGNGDEELADQAIPLASGPVTRAQFIDYLWRHEGEPESAGVCTFTDVEDTHEYFDALCWADENGVAEAYFGVEGHEDGTFEPDELVTVAAVREFLGSFEAVFGAQAVAAADLTTLTGADDEAVLNCGEVLAEFFGEEYAPAEAEDELAA